MSKETREIAERIADELFPHGGREPFVVNVIDKALRDRDERAAKKWLDGHYSGLDQCCDYLEQKATQLFAQRQRDKAVELQSLADELKKELRPQMIKRAEEHEREFPPEVKGKSK